MMTIEKMTLGQIYECFSSPPDAQPEESDELMSRWMAMRAMHIPACKMCASENMVSYLYLQIMANK